MKSIHRSRSPWRCAALALACAGGAAQAQSSIETFGLLDMSVGQFQVAGGAKAKAVDSGNMTTSFIGFKGKEDLGGGLSAVFSLEHFLRADTGAAGRFNGDTFWARNAFVGLGSSQTGSLALGRNTTPLFVSTLLFNAFGDSFGFSPSIRHYFAGGVGAVIGDTGWNDSVRYDSPKFGGLSFAAMANAKDNVFGSGRNASLQGLYFAGPLAATAVWQQAKNDTAPLPAGFQKQDTWQFGLSYDLGSVKLFGQYGRVKTDAAADTTTKLTDFGASVPLGSGHFLAQYGQAKNSGAASNTRKTLSVGYDHDLSKRTDVYAVLMNDKDTGATTGNTYAVGIRHRF